MPNNLELGDRVKLYKREEPNVGIIIAFESRDIVVAVYSVKEGRDVTVRVPHWEVELDESAA